MKDAGIEDEAKLVEWQNDTNLYKQVITSASVAATLHPTTCTSYSLTRDKFKLGAH